MVYVYEMNDFSEWVAAESEQQAIDFYKELTGEVNDDTDYPFALSEKSMNEQMFKDVDGAYGAKDASYSFRQALDLMLASGKEAPFYFACSAE